MHCPFLFFSSFSTIRPIPFSPILLLHAFFSQNFRFFPLYSLSSLILPMLSLCCSAVMQINSGCPFISYFFMKQYFSVLSSKCALSDFGLIYYSSLGSVALAGVVQGLVLPLLHTTTKTPVALDSFLHQLFSSHHAFFCP